jgi:hypothetical protein
MNYNELLSNIKSNHYRKSRTLDTPYAALLAVVELHKPIEGNEHLCGACWFGDGMMSYPCPTIQAIEKELM